MVVRTEHNDLAWQMPILHQMTHLEGKDVVYPKYLDISTKSVALYSSFSLSSRQANSIRLAPLLTDLAYSAILSIFQVMNTGSSTHHLINKLHS